MAFMPIKYQTSMSADKFGIKRVTCETDKIHNTIKETEEKWLTSLLIRASIPKIILKKRQAGELSNQQWRDHLFNTYGMNIYKNLNTSQTQVFKYNSQSEKNVLIGEWTQPEIVYIKIGRSKTCELRLKYWQII